MPAPIKQTILGLDVGGKRIGVAIGDSISCLAIPLITITVVIDDQTKLQEQLTTLIDEHQISVLVVGLPRNQMGLETKQSQIVRQFASSELKRFNLPIIFQDESVTSILAEAELARSKKVVKKTDIDAQAAAIILQDYLDALHG